MPESDGGKREDGYADGLAEGGDPDMRYQVYLFELDSVRNTDEEILAGLTALYEEIVKNGNVVVMTCNQIVDSRGFISLLAGADQRYREQILSLFKNGAIRISQYGNIRTVKQYLLDSLDKDKSFFYSAFPVKRSQTKLIDLIRRSLMYDDKTELAEYWDENRQLRTDDELRELFKEEGQSHSAGIGNDCQEMREVLKNISLWVDAVSRLSLMDQVYNPCKSRPQAVGSGQGADSEKKQEGSSGQGAETEKVQGDSSREVQKKAFWGFYDFLEAVVSYEKPTETWVSKYWSDTVELIKDLDAYKTKKSARSDYLKELREKWKGDRSKCTTAAFAAAIINACYNYTCELSAANIAKHYDVHELAAAEDFRLAGTGAGACAMSIMPTFREDFFRRLQKDWEVKQTEEDDKEGDNTEEDDDEARVQRYLPDETNAFSWVNFSSPLFREVDFERAVRFTGYVDYEEVGKRKNLYRQSLKSTETSMSSIIGKREASVRKIR